MNLFVDDIIFSFLAFSGLYLALGSKYLNLKSFTGILIAKHGGEIIHRLNQDSKLTPGGTTPYNPLKIPAKNMTPAIKNITPSGGTTPYNPLKIPAKKITPIH